MLRACSQRGAGGVSVCGQGADSACARDGQSQGGTLLDADLISCVHQLREVNADVHELLLSLLCTAVSLWPKESRRTPCTLARARQRVRSR